MLQKGCRIKASNKKYAFCLTWCRVRVGEGYGSSTARMISTSQMLKKVGLFLILRWVGALINIAHARESKASMPVKLRVMFHHSVV